MRSSRSGSARGLRSAGSPPEPSAVRLPQPKVKRRGRALPLSNNRNNNDDDGEKESLVKSETVLPAQTEAERSRYDEETELIQSHPIETRTTLLSQQESQVRSETRLQAIRDGRTIFVTATVLGTTVDRHFDVTKGVGQDGNQFFCEICKEFGNVVCCDGCPKVYHATCLDPSDPARQGLDSDEDPWFCGSCRSRGNATRLPFNQARIPSPKCAISKTALVQPDRSMSRPERRTLKRKCNECQQAGGLMTPCVACGVNYIHNPPCREDIDCADGMQQMCSDCCAEAIVQQEEEHDAEHAKIEGERKHLDRFLLPERARERRRRLNSDAEVQNEDLSLDGASNAGEEDGIEDVDDDEDDRGDELSVESEKSPEKKKRKRSNSDYSDRKMKMKVTLENKRKKGDKKETKKKKIRVQIDVERVETPAKLESSSRRVLPRRGLVQPTPAFFFFLNDSRFKIERALARKHRYFNRLPKSSERNELIAREGARWWVKLRLIEQRRYFTMSMRDFEEKVVEWKEEKTIREMVSPRDPGERDVDQNFADDDIHEELSEDEMLVYQKHERLFLSTSVGSKAFAPEPGKSHNRILLELLQDMRFHPLPVFNPLRNEAESGLIDRSRISIPYFEVQGAIATSTGDECSGCTRGWNHVCPVLKRRIPAVENRARLQPPMSSLMATRVGLGLKSKIPDLEEDKESETLLFQVRLSEQAREAMRVPVIPSFTLAYPSERADDVVYFVEECLAMKVGEPPRPSPPDSQGDQYKRATLSRGLLPMRGRRKGDDVQDGPINDGNDGSKSALYKCGRCRTIVDNDTGCIQCRRAQLVINRSKWVGPTGPSSPLKEKKHRDTLRVQTTMLGRLTVKETNFEGQVSSDRAVADAIVKMHWKPSVIVPPFCTVVPRPKRKVTDRQIMELDNKCSDVLGNAMESDSDVKYGQTIEEANVNQEPSPDSSRDINDEGAEEGGEGSRPTRLRPRRLHPVLGASEATEFHEDFADVDRTIDRQRLAEDHKQDATALVKRCLTVACCEIFKAIVRRDPLCLFAEPVPSNVIGYSQVVANPIDIGQIKYRILRDKYNSLSAFVADVRLLCTNACAFNAPGSIYAKTATELYDAIEIMSKRATEWMTAIKDAHSSSFAWKGSDAQRENYDPFQDLRSSWPEAVEMLDQTDKLLEQVASDFTRTKENESAYYGSIAIRRAAAAAEASLASYTDSGGIHSTVVRRSHEDDENLRRYIDSKVIEMTDSPIQLTDVPKWREECILRILRQVQNRRVEGRVMSENGCARCDGMTMTSRTDSKLALKAVRWGRNKRKGELDTVPRVDASRLSLTTGLASRMTHERIGRDLDGLELMELSNSVAEQKDENIDRYDIDDDIDVDGVETEDEERSSNNVVPSQTVPMTGNETIVLEQMGTVTADVSETAAGVDDDDVALDQWDTKLLDVAVSVHGSQVHGWGLFADQPFKKGTVVAEYVGEYISNAVADAREKLYQERRIQDYQFRVDENLVIDATLNGGHGRYINHNCNPNCIAKIIDGLPPNKHLKRVMIIAQRDIRAREEITYDYQFPLELDLDARIPCNCRSLLCRGFMNWDLPEKGSKNRVIRPQKRGGNMRDRIRRLGRPLKKHDEK